MMVFKPVPVLKTEINREVIKFTCIETGKAEERQKATAAAARAAAAFVESAAAGAAAAATNYIDMNV